MTKLICQFSLCLLILVLAYPLNAATDLVKKELSSIENQKEIYIKKIEFRGNTVFSNEQLQLVTHAFRYRLLQPGQFRLLSQVISRYYAAHGYINSGTSPDKIILNNDNLVVNIIEGQLSDIIISTDNLLNSQYLKNRIHQYLADGKESALNVKKLSESLIFLEQNPLIEQVSAQLRPGSTLGSSILDLAIVESKTMTLSTQLDNHVSKNIGAQHLRPVFSHASLTGQGDRLIVDYHRTKGLLSAGVFYSREFNNGLTQLDVSARYNQSVLVKGAFKDLNIENQSSFYELKGQHKFINTLYHSLTSQWFLTVNKGLSLIMGQPFSLSADSSDGQRLQSALGLSLLWQEKKQDHSFQGQLHSQWGIAGLSKLSDQTAIDSDFWLLKASGQYFRRYGWGSLLIKAQMQWSQDSIPSSKAYALGGINTVRGYSENVLVRDKGVFASIQWQVPLTPWLTLCTFVDYGVALNNRTRSITTGRTHLASYGMGLIFNYASSVGFEVFFGKPIKNDLEGSQGQALHLALNHSLSF